MFDWSHNTMLAPMEGVTHPAFRDIMAERGGLGIVCTEFVRISRSQISAKALQRDVVKSPGVPLCVQVMGNDVTKMADAAGIVAKAGADVVDINLGCPAPKAVRSGAGSAMLKNPALLYEVLSAMRQQVPGLLSAKIRAGFDTMDHLLDIGDAVERAGADYIVVHPRRRTDFFEGVADWRPIKQLKDRLTIPVIGNGDCWYAADAFRMQEETGCDGVMIGRPALRNPWIFRQIEAMARKEAPEHPSGEDLFQFIVDTVARYKVAFPKMRRGPVGKIKELIGYLGRAVNDQRQWRKNTLRQNTLDDILSYAESTLLKLSPAELDLDAHGTLGLENSGRV